MQEVTINLPSLSFWQQLASGFLVGIVPALFLAAVFCVFGAINRATLSPSPDYKRASVWLVRCVLCVAAAGVLIAWFGPMKPLC